MSSSMPVLQVKKKKKLRPQILVNHNVLGLSILDYMRARARLRSNYFMGDTPKISKWDPFSCPCFVYSSIIARHVSTEIAFLLRDRTVAMLPNSRTSNILHYAMEPRS